MAIRSDVVGSLLRPPALVNLTISAASSPASRKQPGWSGALDSTSDTVADSCHLDGRHRLKLSVSLDLLHRPALWREGLEVLHGDDLARGRGLLHVLHPEVEVRRVAEERPQVLGRFREGLLEVIPVGGQEDLRVVERLEEPRSKV